MSQSNWPRVGLLHRPRCRRSRCARGHKKELAIDELLRPRPRRADSQGAAGRRLRRRPRRSRRRPSRACWPAATCSASPRPAPARPPPSPCRSCTASPPTAGRAQRKGCRVLVLSPDPRARHARSPRASAPTAAISASPSRSSSAASAIGPQIEALARGVDVLVATPGRLLDHLERAQHRAVAAPRSWCSTRPTRCSTWASCRRSAASSRSCRRSAQNLFFSATMPREIGKLAAELLRDPVQGLGDARRPPPSTASRSACSTSSSQQQARAAGRAVRRSADVARARLHAHQARRRPGRPPSRGGRHQRRRHPRQQEPGASASGRWRPSSAGEDPRRWSPPTSPRAASTSTRSRTSSTSSCRTCRRATCTASAARRAPAPRASPSRSATREERDLLRDIERLTRQSIPAEDRRSHTSKPTRENGPSRADAPQWQWPSSPAVGEKTRALLGPGRGPSGTLRDTAQTGRRQDGLGLDESPGIDG